MSCSSVAIVEARDTRGLNTETAEEHLSLVALIDLGDG